MDSSQVDFWREPLRRRAKETPCPRIVWVHIKVANKRYPPWEYDSRATSEWTRNLLRIIARSSTVFPSQNPELKESLKLLKLEWLKPSQISRIRECSAPRRKRPRHPTDALFGWRRVDPVRSPRCKQIFWAWRSDQKTCDSHWWAASMLRVEKHRKVETDRIRNVRQLKDARQQLKRARRANRQQIQKLKRDRQQPPITQSKLQAQNELADFRLLQAVWLDMIETPADTDDPERLDVMIVGGYVLPPERTSETYRLSRDGLLLLGELRKRTKEVIR
jgi:hypothetical protein